jgi:hypothetical protein
MKNLFKKTLLTAAVSTGLFITSLFGIASFRSYLQERNNYIDKIRKEPIIRTQESLREQVEDVKKLLKLEDLQIDAYFAPNIILDNGVDMSQSSFCYRTATNHYGIVLGGFGRKRWGIEHELFHIKEIRDGKAKPGLINRFTAELRAQDFCLRNYDTNGNKLRSNLKH